MKVIWALKSAAAEPVTFCEERCDWCLQNENCQQLEPLHAHPVPVRAWQRVAADIGTLRGKGFLIMADYIILYTLFATTQTTQKLSV